MNHGALRALEFDRVVEAVRSFALTPLGEAELADLRPQRDARKVQTALDLTGEMVRYVADRSPLELAAPSTIQTSIATLAIEGRALDALELRGLADFLASVELTRKAIADVPGEFPLLKTIVQGAASFKAEVDEIRRVVQPSGDLVDRASPQLQAIRERLRKQRSRLRSTLESYLRSKDTARYLQDEVVTDRSGRYVLMVRAEHRSAIPGIVHGTSTSGATLFLEPLSTVEINNEVVALEQQEAEEIHRILLALSNRVRARAGDLHRTLTTATELDALQAKARFAEVVGGTQPMLAADGHLELVGARHPLLIRAVTARLGDPAPDPDEPRGAVDGPDGPVPVDIRLAPPTSALIITGPNTGGKTVALKTAGLLALMAQAGLHIPAERGSRLPVFRAIFADIGDEQSIAANLSTFSWHVSNIVSMDRSLALPALVLLDEIGAGTDPTEGGALGMAVIDHFRSRGALVVATTHYDMLKSYASTTDGVGCAAFGFDAETFVPSYRLVYGSPGRSLALEIAERLGVPAAIVASAREHRSAREAQLADQLNRMEEQLAEIERERQEIARSRRAAADAESAARAREAELAEREQALTRRFDDRVQERVREARQQIDAIVDELKRQTVALAADAARDPAAVTTGHTGAARAEARAAVDAVASQFDETKDEAEPAITTTEVTTSVTVRSVAVGERVRIGGLGIEGILRALGQREGEVEVRGKRLRVARSDLAPTRGGRSAEPPKAPVVEVRVESPPDAAGELNLIGCTVDEARARAEKFLDQAILSEAGSVRIIHGHGTGQLRRAIAELLSTHPMVATFHAAAPAEGGDGVTVAELKD